MVEWITNTITTLGYGGIALLMLVENLFPPIPSEVIMPLAGFVVARGEMSFVPVILAGVVGSMIGALPWYYAGKIYSKRRISRLADKYGKWFAISGEDIEKADRWFKKYGRKAVFYGRMVPGIRTVISLPAGINNMNMASFLVYTLLGSSLWVLLLTLSGYILGENYYLVEEYIGYFSLAVVIIVVTSIIVWLVKKRQGKGK
ncbi:DedA family protein [Oscillatoria salina]|uniref:DedA family protein n=1 Tax=Oscillatoria salina TaxID=331517 RepID=UPI0013BAE6B7|nr:DedA family protein [Oscillatoria salina]MBZ8182373.1 DedA family protein [Oscillatoria salina IIICB1]NET90158.1 DedA family protein [Kamptonema sp. SIO1D9]